LVCNAGVLRCVVVFVVVATLEASDWLVFLLLLAFVGIVAELCELLPIFLIISHYAQIFKM
jgi:hypothetical protein